MWKCDMHLFLSSRRDNSPLLAKDFRNFDADFCACDAFDLLPVSATSPDDGVYHIAWNVHFHGHLRRPSLDALFLAPKATGFPTDSRH